MTIEKAREELQLRLDETERNIARKGHTWGTSSNDYYRPRDLAAALKVALFVIDGVMKP